MDLDAWMEAEIEAEKTALEAKEAAYSEQQKQQQHNALQNTTTLTLNYCKPKPNYHTISKKKKNMKLVERQNRYGNGLEGARLKRGAKISEKRWARM